MKKPGPDRSHLGRDVKRKEQRERLAEALRSAMVSRGVTNRELAMFLERLDPEINEEKVSTYRRGNVALPLYLAQSVAKRLGMRSHDSSEELVDKFGYDPMLMVRLFGLAPEDEEADRLMAGSELWSIASAESAVIDRLRVLERLEQEVVKQELMLSGLERDRAARLLVQAVLESRRYAMALWPVQAGPTDQSRHLLHVSDRVDIRRLDGGATSASAVWQDLGSALAQARAWPSVAQPRWPNGQAESLDVRDPRVSRWNLQRLDAPRRPQVSHAHPGFPAVAFSAVVSSSWVGNLASIVALVLGYGLTSTTDLARRLDGLSRYTPGTGSRNRVHSELLRNPSGRQIWAHASTIDPSHPRSPWLPDGGSSHPELVHVRLVEDDELLEATAEDRRHTAGFKASDLPGWQRARDQAVESAPDSDRVLMLRVPHVEWGSTTKWAHTFERAHCVLSHLAELGLNPWAGLEAAQSRWVEDDDGLTRPAFTWLRERGSPFVFAPIGVARPAPGAPSDGAPAPS